MGQNLHFQDLAGKDPVKKEVKKKSKRKLFQVYTVGADNFPAWSKT